MAIFLRNIHLLLTVPPVEGELPELWFTVYEECGDKRAKNKITPAQFQTNLSNRCERSEKIWNDYTGKL